MVRSLNMVLDGDELLELPYIGERLKKSSAAAPSARGMCSYICTYVLSWMPGLSLVHRDATCLPLKTSWGCWRGMPCGSEYVGIISVGAVVYLIVLSFSRTTYIIIVYTYCAVDM